MIRGMDTMPCEGCMHGEICSLRKDFEAVWKACNYSHGITANTATGKAYDLTSEPDINVTITCRYYKKVVTVR